MYKDQKNLLHVAFGDKETTCKGEKVYANLVFKVFFDALSSAYPLFFNLVEKKEFEKVVQEFMSFGSNSIEIWKMPNEFRKFIKKEKKFREVVFVDELLWFEWVEVKLMMKNYKNKKRDKFSYKNSYILSKSSVLKKLKYRVFEQNNFDQKGEFYLLGYYDFHQYRVLFIEISEIMYMFLKELKKYKSKKAIKKIVKMSGQSKKNVEEFFADSLEDLVKKGIIEIKI
jgi:hypothetical protein